MSIKIPEKQRAEFDRAALLAIEKVTFTPSELAEELGMGVFVASIMVGYMEKSGLATKGKGDDVRRAKITLEEWDAIGRKIENYQPAPEPEPEIFVPEAEDDTTVDLSDIITEELFFIKKKLGASEGFITLSEGEVDTQIAFDDISVIFLHRGRFFSKSTMTFSSESEKPVKVKQRADTVLFKNREYTQIKELAEKIAQRLGIRVEEF